MSKVNSGFFSIYGRMAKGVVAALVLVMLILAFFPTVVGMRVVYQPLLKRLEAGDFRLHVGDIRLRWFSPLQAKNIEIAEKEGGPLLKIEELNADRGLLSLLIGGGNIGRIEILNPRVDLELSNRTNIGRLIDAVSGRISGNQARAKRGRLALDVELQVRGLSCVVSEPGMAEPLVVVPPVNLDLAYRGVEGEAKIFCQSATLLQKVELTPQLMKLGLGYAVPVLAESAWMRGRISLKTGPIEVPLSNLINAAGTAEISLHEVQSGPSHKNICAVLDFIAKMRGRPSQHELVFVEGAVVSADMKLGRVHHSGLRLGLPKIDERLQISTSGSVGLADRSLEMVLQIPVPVEHLASRDSVKELGVPMLNLPVSGTLSDPIVDWSGLRRESAELLGLIRKQVQEESPATAALLSGLEGLAEGKADQAIAGALDLIQGIRERRQDTKSEEKANDAEVTSDNSVEKKPGKSRPVREALKNLLKKIP